MALENSYQPSQGSSVSNAMLMLWLDSKQTKNEAGLLFNIFAAATMVMTPSAYAQIGRRCSYETCYLLSLLSKLGAGKNDSSGTI